MNQKELKNIEVKSRATWVSEFDIPDNIVDSVRIFNSFLVLNSFSEVFGIQRLIPDPYFFRQRLEYYSKRQPFKQEI